MDCSCVVFRLPSPVSRFSGHSLLELLVVLLIVGVLATMAMLSVGVAGSGRLAEQEARRIAGLVRLSCEEAVLHGDSRALSFVTGGAGYGFMRLAGERWLPRQGDTWRVRQMPESVTVALTVEGRSVPLDEDAAGRPHLVCLPSGELVPFELTLGSVAGESVWRLAGDWDGEINLERADDRAAG